MLHRLVEALVLTGLLGAGACSSSGPRLEGGPEGDQSVDAGDIVVGASLAVGFSAGDSAADWSLWSSEGELVHLHDFIGQVVFFEAGSAW